jgi:hypothetical protein
LSERNQLRNGATPTPPAVHTCRSVPLRWLKWPYGPLITAGIPGSMISLMRDV